MSRILVGGISPESEVLLRSYLNIYIPDAEIEPLKAVGIRGKMKTQAIRPDVLLVILDETLYSSCVGTCDDVLSLPKVHKYVDDDGFKEFLISKFGKLDNESSTNVIPPDVLMSTQREDEDFGDTSSIAVVSESEQEIINNSEEIKRLKDKLSQSELMIKNLTAQLEEANDNNDLSDFVKRIRELETQLEEKSAEIKELSEHSGEKELSYEELGKLAKAEKILEDYDKLKEELKATKENYADLQFKKSKLEDELDTTRTAFYEFRDKVEVLEKEKNKLEVQIFDKESDYDELYFTLNTTSAELASKKSELDLMKKNNTELSGVVTELEIVKKQLSEKSLDYDNLIVDFGNEQAKVDELTEQLKNTIEDLEARTSEVNSKSNEIKILNDSCKESDKKIEDLSNKVIELEKNLETKDSEINSLSKNSSEEVNSLRETCKGYESEIETLKSEIDEKVNLVSELKSEIESKTKELEKLKISYSEEKEETISKLQENISSLKSEIDSNKSEIKSLNEQLILKIDELEVKNSALNDTLSEKSDLEEQLHLSDKKLSNITSERDDLNEQLVSVNDKLNEAKSELGVVKSTLVEKDSLLNERDIKISDLETQNAKLGNEINMLQESLEINKGDKTSINKLEDELLEEKRKVTKLSSELEVLKKSNNSSRTTELREEISKLKSENEKLLKDGASAEEIKSLKKELEKSKTEISNLKSDLTEQVELVNELNDSVFLKMAYIASPKLACDIGLDISLDLTKSRSYCIASGSLESNLLTYQMIKKTVKANPNTRFLVVDLVTDSCIDRELGVQKINSPINWLNGSSDFKEFLAPTKYNNVKCLSTGFAFLNDLYLLQVDWQKRISEIQGFGDVVIFNIGCLNNTVTKVLYNTFSSVMQTNVVVKATPINLRTLILSMTGLKKTHNTLVCCVGFDEALSKPMYQKLTQKYKAEIFKETDVLKL